jgi:multidrug efflux pump subunit AcrA (membrane-fusion protein)
MDKFTIPENPNQLELNQSLSKCANNISRVIDLVAKYKANVSIAQTKYKRLLARAKIKNASAKTATMQNALAEIDDTVITAQDELEQANAIFLVAEAELEGWQAQFVAVRKMCSLKETEVKGGLDRFTGH